mmetsp:Transcript_20715/g.20823  ORF Transcript_20715/g.20823 Transcript_20715/m.20823 type:complete len:355 (-) Transcript_20715:127-1191(-)
MDFVMDGLHFSMYRDPPHYLSNTAPSTNLLTNLPTTIVSGFSAGLTESQLLTAIVADNPTALPHITNVLLTKGVIRTDNTTQDDHLHLFWHPESTESITPGIHLEALGYRQAGNTTLTCKFHVNPPLGRNPIFALEKRAEHGRLNAKNLSKQSKKDAEYPPLPSRPPSVRSGNTNKSGRTDKTATTRSSYKTSTKPDAQSQPTARFAPTVYGAHQPPVPPPIPQSLLSTTSATPSPYMTRAEHEASIRSLQQTITNDRAQSRQDVERLQTSINTTATDLRTQIDSVRTSVDNTIRTSMNTHSADQEARLTQVITATITAALRGTTPAQTTPAALTTPPAATPDNQTTAMQVEKS